ncbi:MAG: RNA polymerase sigma factor [Desulfobacteraceae bacterium]|nr:RNA polymerase sigma factor [Desulfobacteraceae bacterium]
MLTATEIRAVFPDDSYKPVPLPAAAVNVKEQVEKLTDAEIIGRVVGGDTNAFETLLLRYEAFVHRVVARHVPRDRVEEVAQDVFISAYRTLPSYSGRSGFGKWLHRIAARRCCDFWRERSRQNEIPFSQLSEEQEKWLDGLTAARSMETFEDAAAGREAREILHLALARMSPENRTALTLVYLEGLAVNEAAGIIGWNSVVLRVRLHRAKKQLRHIIGEILESREQHETES